MANIIVTAHAGCEGTEDNSWISVKTAKDTACDVVELDVRKKDDELWLSHNLIKVGDHPVKLSDAFMLLRSAQQKINCDLKEEGIFADVLALARKLGVDEKLIFTGSVTLDDAKQNETERQKIFFNVENLFTKEEAEGLRENPGSLDEAKLRSIFEIYRENGLTGMNIFYGLVNEKMLQIAAEYDVRVAVWTVDEEADMKKMMQLPIYGVTTRLISKWRELEEK